MAQALSEFQRMTALVANGVPGATTYDLLAALGKGRVTLVAAGPVDCAALPVVSVGAHAPAGQ